MILIILINVKKHLYIFFFITCFSIKGQTDFTIKNRGFQPATAFSLFNNTFNLKDYYYGISMGMEDLGYEWGVRFNFQFRPFYKRTQIQVNDHLITQYREKKYFVSIDLDKRFLHFDLDDVHTQFFAGTQIGFLLGKYRGTRANAETLFNVVPMGGICFNFREEIFIKTGLCYFRDKLLEVSDVKMMFNIIIVMPENTDNNGEIPYENESDYY